MSYDAIFIIPLLIITTTVAVMYLAKSRPHAAAFTAFGASMYFWNVVYWRAFIYTGRPGLIEVNEWRDQHVDALAVAEQAKAALSYLPFAGILFCIGAFAAIKAWKKQRSPALLAVSLFGSLPTALLAVWAIWGTLLIWSPDDPRWTLGYYLEWEEAGADITKAGPCSMILTDLPELRTKIEDAEVEEALLKCKEVCRAQAQSGNFNPGMFLGQCNEAFGDGTNNHPCSDPFNCLKF